MKPNIVFFMLDQLSAKWLEAADRDGICPVPNIRALKERGVTFENAITSNPVCCPARATLATGLTTRGHGVLQNGYRLDPQLPTFMRVLQNAGYRTGALGKVHFHPHYAGLYPDYRQYGFDVTHITEDPRGGEWLDWVKQTHPKHYDAALATVWPTEIPEFAAYGPESENLRDRIREIRSSFDWATPEFPVGDAGHYALPFPEEVGQTRWITKHAVDFISSAPRDVPLLAHVSYVQPHGPFNAPGEYFGAVAVDRIPNPVSPEWADDPHAPACFRDGTMRFQPVVNPRWREYRHAYFADIAHLDAQLGRIVAALEQAGRLSETYIVLLADHGEMLFDHGCRSKGEMHYDACIRVPLTIAGPGVASGASVPSPVQLEDIFPTVLDLAEREAPAMPVMGTHLTAKPDYTAGRSLVGFLTGEFPETWRTAAYAESYNNLSDSSTTHWARTVRTERYRYTYYPSSPWQDNGRGSGEQLFDLIEDPDETKNLVSDPAHAETRNTMRNLLLDAVIKQDYPHTRQDLFALGVH